VSPSLQDAVHANLLYSQQRAARLGPRATTEHLEPWLLIDADDPDGVFDAAIPTGVVTRPDRSVSDALTWFATRARRCNFFLRSDSDEAVSAAVERVGFAPLGDEPVLVLDDVAALTPVAAADLAIEPVETGVALAEYAATGNELLSPEIKVAIAHTAFAMRGARLLLGRSQGAAIATSMCVVTGSVIGVFNVNVTPSHRRRGYGAAMTLAAVAAGARDGGRVAWLGSTPMSDALYRGLGFRELYRYVSYVSPPTRDRTRPARG
jgi:ribosomal protein S18 acetylase RimI-like enzyme